MMTGKEPPARAGGACDTLTATPGGSSGDEMEATMKGLPHRTLILPWVEDRRMWAELPWADWVRFRGLGKERSSLLMGAVAGAHYFLVCMLCIDGELRNVIPHRYVVSTDARLVHGFDGLEVSEREESDRIEGL